MCGSALLHTLFGTVIYSVRHCYSNFSVAATTAPVAKAAAAANAATEQKQQQQQQQQQVKVKVTPIKQSRIRVL
jgi:ribosomal protein L12E/L44/L45/RPP1/RPP2